MRAVIQRVTRATVDVDGNIIASINKGLCVLVGFTATDTEKDLQYICQKIIGLRIFDDENAFMNLSIADVNGEILVVPQFTLYGDARKGRRPSYSLAMKPEEASQFFDTFVSLCKQQNPRVQQGKFQAYMQVSITNDGPVTILLDSSRLF
ncbi:MAG: D-tyrosyl-tRNA(Tyr) deacylase [Spirochaetes bacterium]|nr:D-tyrosyl-tRNA(Tyr) deacylase [Spirochaetota bacterium]